MKLLILCSLLIASVFSRFCGKPPVQAGKPVPTLGIRATNNPAGNSEGRFYAAVHTGELSVRGRWTPWRLIDNRNCDDFEPGKMSFFDDFKTIRDDWDAIAIYACTNDGVLIEDVSYWNGRGQSRVQTFDEGVFGPFGKRCLKNAVKRDSDGSTVYSDIYVDGDYSACDGVLFKTGVTGRVWTGKLPFTIPPCGNIRIGESKAMAPGVQTFVQPQSPSGPSTDNNKYSAFEQQLLNYLMAVVGIALLLFVSNSCLMAYAIKNKNGASSGGYYGKVAQTDIE